MDKKRVTILTSIILFCFIAVLFRLADIMLVRHRELAKRSRTQYLIVQDIKPKRGTVYDRKGRELAVNLELDSLYGIPSEVEDAKDTALKLSSLIKVSDSTLEHRLSRGGDFVWISRKLDPKITNRIKEMNLPGLEFLPETKRVYPKGTLAAHVLGFCDIDNKGIEGIELKYDNYIKGRSRKLMLGRDAFGKNLSTGSIPEISGDNIVLTIDEDLQYIVDKELDKAMQETHARAAVAVMMNPETGEILAMADRPAYDPNNPSAFSPADRRNRAITDCYEPGSVFKAILVSGVIQENIFPLSQTFDCSKGSIEVGGRIIHDAERHGVLTLTQVVQKSSNVGAIQIGMRFGKERYYKYIKAFGFGEKTGIDLPGEVSGMLKEPSRWSGVSIGSISIGQEIAVTPLQLLRAYCAIANGGYLLKPYIVSEITDAEGKPVKVFGPQRIRRVISERTSRIVTDILTTVTEDGGTAAKAALDGNPVAGKTGTAQMVDPETRRYSHSKYASSFIGFVPADKPRIALIVVIFEPKGEHYGGHVAGPVFKRIAEQSLTYLNIPIEKDNHLLLVEHDEDR